MAYSLCLVPFWVILKVPAAVKLAWIISTRWLRYWRFIGSPSCWTVTTMCILTLALLGTSRWLRNPSWNLHGRLQWRQENCPDFAGTAAAAFLFSRASVMLVRRLFSKLPCVCLVSANSVMRTHLQVLLGDTSLCHVGLYAVFEAFGGPSSVSFAKTEFAIWRFIRLFWSRVFRFPFVYHCREAEGNSVAKKSQETKHK